MAKWNSVVSTRDRCFWIIISPINYNYYCYCYYVFGHPHHCDDTLFPDDGVWVSLKCNLGMDSKAAKDYTQLQSEQRLSNDMSQEAVSCFVEKSLSSPEAAL